MAYTECTPPAVRTRHRGGRDDYRGSGTGGIFEGHVYAISYICHSNNEGGRKMLMSKRCPECQHIAEVDSAAQNCPACGARYSKAEDVVPAPREHGAARRTPKAMVEPVARKDEFIEELRAASTYPTFRGFVQIFYVIGLILAVALFVGGVIGTFMSKGSAMSFGVGTVMALLFVILARLFKETWLMLADMSDAMIRMARRQQ